MGFKQHLNRNWPAGLAGAVLAVSIGLLLHAFTFGSGLVNLSYDLLTVASKPRTSPTNAVLVFMDEASHDKLKQPRNAPWDRALHAQLIEKLSTAGAKAIVLDIVFSDPAAGDGADAQLARALAESRRVILAADHVAVGSHEKRFVMPIEWLRTNAAGIGSAEVTPGRDLIVRRHTPEEQLPSLAAATAEFIGAFGANGTNWMRYYGPPNSLPSISYEKALLEAPGDLFRDKIVFVGARILTRFAGDRKDEYRSPYSFWMKTDQFVSGAEIQATAFLNLLRGDWFSRLSPNAERALVILFGAVAGFAIMQFRPWSAVLAGIALVACAALGGYAAAQQTGCWFPWLLPVAQITVALSFSVTVNSFRLYLERRLYEQTLSLYLSPKLVKKFAHDERFRQPGAEKQIITILFTDIANFTPLSEGMDSDDLARLMNSYFQKAVNNCIHATEGTVVKYIGDAIFAFWNAPDQQHDHAARACEAALRFHEQALQEVNGQPLVTRLGIHTGVATVGNFGSVQRIDYTALGENVNLASRIEGLNKHLGTTTLISRATHAEIGDTFATRFVGRFRLKGFEKSVEIFELLGRHSTQVAPWHKSFNSSLEQFSRGEFDEAARGFRDVLKVRAGDGPSQFYLETIERLRAEPPSPKWAGEIELKEK